MQQQMVCNNILDCTWLLYDRSVGCCAAHSSLIDLYLSAINQLAVSHTVGKNGCTQKWLLCGTAEGNSKGNGTRSTLPHLTRAALASMQCDCCWRVLFPFCLLSSKNCGSDVRRDAIIPPPSDLFYFLWPTFRVSIEGKITIWWIVVVWRQSTTCITLGPLVDDDVGVFFSFEKSPICSIIFQTEKWWGHCDVGGLCTANASLLLFE